MAKQPLRLGTRASALARWQAGWVADRLAALAIAVELVPIVTQGDTSQRDPIGSLGSVGIFTKELQRALQNDEIDLAVHSLKDLPTEQVERLTLAAVPPRESPFDALLTGQSRTLDELPHGAVVGTGSLRRQAQLLHHRPDLRVEAIRGNVDTRLQKLADGRYDALVLAHAGLKRLGLEAHIRQVLPPEILLPAVGQGALGIEIRADDASTRTLIASLDDLASHRAVIAERSLLAALCGGCLAPVGAWCREQADRRLRLDAVVLSANGRERITAFGSALPGDAARLGVEVAGKLIAQGATALIVQSRQAP